jgi:hypothetical protein
VVFQRVEKSGGFAHEFPESTVYAPPPGTLFPGGDAHLFIESA